MFEGILRQYMQLSARNGQYKSSLPNFELSQTKLQGPADNGITAELNVMPFEGEVMPTSPSGYSGEFTSEGLSDIKEVYEKMEFDAMRYNRNFDTQTGAEKI